MGNLCFPMSGVKKSELPHFEAKYEVERIKGKIPSVFCGSPNTSSLYAVFNLRLMYRLLVLVVCACYVHSNIPGYYSISISYICFQFIGTPFEFLVYYGAKFRNRWFLGLWLIIGYLDFMGAVMLGIMSFFSTRQILFNMSFFFRSVSTINNGAKVMFALLWFNGMWWMYMVVWAAFIDMGRENEDKREAYNRLVEEEEEAAEEKEKEEGKEKEKVETSQPSSATSNRSGGRKSTGYEYVIPPAALAITSLNNSIKSFEDAMDQ